LACDLNLTRHKVAQGEMLQHARQRRRVGLGHNSKMRVLRGTLAAYRLSRFGVRTGFEG
jgi:hypothetical protein